MDDWWMLLRRRGIPPSEIRRMTIPEMKLEVMCALDPAYHQSQVDTSPAPSEPEPDEFESTEDFFNAWKSAGG